MLKQQYYTLTNVKKVKSQSSTPLNVYVMMMMAIQKILLSVVSKFVVGVCDGLDECEISRPEILPQSTPVSSPLPDCDAYNPPSQYISIHVRLFLSLAV